MSDPRKPSKELSKGSKTQTTTEESRGASVRVVIGGVVLDLSTAEKKPEEVRKLETYLNNIIDDIRRDAPPGVDLDKQIALAGMTVTAQLFEKDEELDELKRRITAELHAAIESVDGVETEIKDLKENHIQLTEGASKPKPPKAKKNYIEFE